MAEQRCAVVAVLGAPNAGKSTLVNALVGAKVAAVTQKVQTTRALVRGIVMHDEVQLILIDTPGVFAPKRRLDRAMVAAAWSALEGADAIIHVVDAAAHAHTTDKAAADARAIEDTSTIAAKLKQMEIASILVLNKVDAVPRPVLLELTTKLVEEVSHRRFHDRLQRRRCRHRPHVAGARACRPVAPEDQTMDAPACAGN